jgi:hypothetical protein
MTPITRATTFHTSRAPAEALDLGKGWLSNRVSTVVGSESPDRVELKTGSQAKMRLLGGAFIAASSLPARTVIAVQPGTGGGTDVTVTACDAIGFGLKTGMRGKYGGWLGEIVAGIQSAVS